jgi:hypothetical protein
MCTVGDFFRARVRVRVRVRVCVCACVCVCVWGGGGGALVQVGTCTAGWSPVTVTYAVHMVMIATNWQLHYQLNIQSMLH